jgi:hypothetical protein
MPLRTKSAMATPGGGVHGIRVQDGHVAYRL